MANATENNPSANHHEQWKCVIHERQLGFAGFASFVGPALKQILDSMLSSETAMSRQVLDEIDVFRDWIGGRNAS